MLILVRLLCCVFVFFGFVPLHASSLGGLKFHGSEKSINQRSSYDVFGANNIQFSDNFSIEFDLALYPTTAFGYIVRIKNRESNRIYNLFYDGQGDHIVFKFNEEGTHSLIVASLDKQELLEKPWLNMKISFDLKSDSIKLSLHDKTFGTKSNNLPDSYAPIIIFGKSDHIIDVPSFAIKYLSVGNQERYIFELKESEGNVVHDTGGNAIGKVVNPEWLINDAYHWRYKVSFQSQSVAGTNYNPQRKEIYYFNQDSLHIYNVRSGEREVKIFDTKCPVKLVLGTNFIDAEHDRLYSYEVYYASPNEEYSGATVASLDLNTFGWTAQDSSQLPSQLHHHGSYFNPLTDSYTLFGGFGNMRYSKSFYSFDLNTQEWSRLEGFTGDSISPRYFPSVGYLKKNNSIYIFGGMGNESGEQTVGRKYYYDLYKVDLDKKHVTKLWHIEWERDNVVPVRGMVILNDSCFYTLCYPEHFSESFLKLYRFSIKDGSYEILGDSIPIYSDKITTNANLYYDSGLNNLYAVVQEFEDDIASDLKVYSLAFPPITAKALASYASYQSSRTLVILLVSISLVAGVGYIVYRKLNRKNNTEHAPSASADDEADAGNERKAAPLPTINAKTTTPLRANSIYLFGEFAVRDRNNRDITYLFSEQLKQIFCLVLQYSTTEEGITSQRLSSILWPDKPADKVKNSRGVTINHLRKALSELDGIELVYEKGYFKLVQSGAFYCDYTRCIQIISSAEIEEQREEYLEILARGKFLQLSDHPLYDSLKEALEKQLEPVLLVEIEKTMMAEQYQTTLALAEALLNIDPLNEVAFTFQLKAMQKLKMNDEARMRYQAFVVEYRKAMGNEYPHAYKSLG